MLVLLMASAAAPAPPQLLQKPLVRAGGAAIVTQTVVSRIARQATKPPLRLELGRQEEAKLVDVAPPGPLRLIARAIVLLLIFLPTLLTALPARYSRLWRERIWFPLLKIALASAGTAFIKWGQWASCRPDIFPERLCAILSELHSQAPTHGYGHTLREVEAALGAPIGETFERFDERPFASGSIAQMHRATQRGADLAVKVRHPNVVERIQTDFALMTALAECAAPRRATHVLGSTATIRPADPLSYSRHDGASLPMPLLTSRMLIARPPCRREPTRARRPPRVLPRTRCGRWSAKVPGLRWLNLKTSVAQFSSTMVAQTRLDIEAEHLRRFRWNFGGKGWRDVLFPRVLLGMRRRVWRPMPRPADQSSYPDRSAALH